MSGAGERRLAAASEGRQRHVVIAKEDRIARFAELDAAIAQEQGAASDPQSASGDAPGKSPSQVTGNPGGPLRPPLRPKPSAPASGRAQRKRGQRGERADLLPRARERRRKKSERHLAPESRNQLAALTATFAQTLRGDLKLQSVIQSDLKGFRTDLQTLIRAEFRLRRGRPPDPLIDDACRMMDQGKSAAQALRVQRPGWDKTDPYLRYLAEKGLRAAKGRRGRKQDRREPGKKGGRGKRKPENLVPDSTQRFSDPGTE